MTTDLQLQIEELNNLIQAKEAEMLAFEIDPDGYEDQYCEMLDESFGPFMSHYSASDVLREIDPIAYRQGLLDWADGLDVCDDLEYQALEEELEELQEERDLLQEELEDLIED